MEKNNSMHFSTTRDMFSLKDSLLQLILIKQSSGIKKRVRDIFPLFTDVIII